MPRVTVVVVTHQSAGDLARCLGSVHRALAGAPGTARALVVDSGSTDGTPARVRADFPEAELLPLPANAGFAAAANAGIRHAAARSDDYVFLLNPDTEVDPDFLVEALAVAGPADVAAVQSLLLLDPERDAIDSSGGVQQFLGFGFCRDHRRPRAAAEPAGGEIAFASGAACLLRLEALRRVGAFDEELFLYGEDLDLGWRLRLAGYRSLLAPRSLVWHRHEFGRHPDKLFHLERARLRTLLKNSAPRTLAVLALPLLAAELALVAVAARQGWLGDKARAWRAVLGRRGRASLAAERRRVQGLRRVGDRALTPLVAARLDQPGVTGVFVGGVVNPLLAGLWRLLRPLL